MRENCLAMGKYSNRVENPFFITTEIPDKYFCDRNADTENIISKLLSGNNVVLVATRRIGKSSLLHHILGQKAIKRSYNTLYVDIYNTNSPEDFINAFKSALNKARFAKKEMTEFEAITKEYSGKLGLSISPLSAEGTMRVEKKKKQEVTIDRIFDFLEHTSKPNIVVFDEFQQIEEYEEKITRLLRSKIQGMNNTRFIYSGSSVDMLSSMFTEYNQPFYGSSSLIGLKKIPEEVYSDFCRRMFKLYGKDISPDAISFIYTLMLGNTLNTQQLANTVFTMTRKHECADISIVKAAMDRILDERAEAYKSLLYTIGGEKERRVVVCLAAEGIATEITSSVMLQKYNLGTASTVQNACRNLSSGKQKVIIKLAKGAYTLSDKYFELWLARVMNILDMKYTVAPDLMQKDKELSSQLLSAIAPKSR